VTNDPGYDMGDLIRAMLGNPLDALARADIVSDVEPARPPSAGELAAIQDLAENAARLQDEIQAAVGDKGGELRKLKSQLKDQMLRHGLRDVSIAGRPPIELTESSSRKPTRKAIVSAMQKAMIKQLGDEEKGMKEGKMKALNLWNLIEPSKTNSLSIPDPSPPEMESPY